MEPCSVRSIRSIRIAIAAFVLCAAPGAHAVMYKWVDAEGSVTYSNTPPPDPGQVRDLTRIEDLSTVPADKRPKEASTTDREKASGGSAVAQPAAAPPGKSEPALPRSADAPVTLRDMQVLPRESTPGTLPRAAQREAESAPPVTRGVQTEAVRDPCLRSADPKCHERNKDSYHPYLGYAPGSTPQPAVSAVGASNPASAGGAVGGAVRR